ncbi:hypothetical protein ACMFMG_005474 [Clarireedia jacksonii]
MGGAVAQQVTLAAPKGMVRKLVLAGTRTSGSPNTVHGPSKMVEALSQSETQEEFVESWALSFFNNTVQGRLAAKASWGRILSRSQDRVHHMPMSKPPSVRSLLLVISLTGRLMVPLRESKKLQFLS